ncbi:RHS repeat domain-containing protein [Parachitinimonas caeni]|uniref:RHS repeat protein n=1 Tax=Parachitinimonas caeni TaxID=3031301 RepID=A0ABT7DVM0_9NEIS|nr:RHS repeat domain-containing protein [Parachitinimonas caeni]MDK2124112.1 RHS repeat protein [Parachitinimonas caeni]
MCNNQEAMILQGHEVFETQPNHSVTHACPNWQLPAGIEVTRYEYGDIGQIERITWPDGSWVAYDYDCSQRLVHIRDSAGHSIEYTFDSRGNLLTETMHDPDGILQAAVGRLEEEWLSAVLDGASEQMPFVLN